MRNLLLLAAFFGLSCDTFLEANPSYCGSDADCQTGLVCDLAHHRCTDPVISGDPQLTGISPGAAKRQGGGTITLTGSGFRDGMQVDVNGTLVPATFVSATTLTFTAPAAPSLCGPVPVYVQRDGQPIAGKVELRYRYSTLSMGTAAQQAVVTGTKVLGVAELTGDDLSDVALATDAGIAIATTVSGAIGTVQKHGTSSYNRVKFADVDGDGVRDVVAVGNTQVDFFRGTGFAQGSGNIFSGGTLADLAVGNLGSPAVTNYVTLPTNVAAVSSYVYSKLMNSFGQSGVIIGSFEQGATSAIVDDLNNDGVGDIAIGQQDTSAVVICRGVGSIMGFDCVTSVQSLGGDPAQLATIVEGNRTRLLVTSKLSSNGNLAVVSFDSDGTAHQESYGSFAGVPIGLFGEDMDCDGLKDIVIYATGSNALSVYNGLGDGKFEKTPESIPLNLNLGTTNMDDIYSLGLGKFNGDSKPDLAALKVSGGARSLLGMLNTSD